MSKSQISPIIIEPHPKDYTGYSFITLIQYRTQNILTLVDNIDNKQVCSFVLDLCGPNMIDEEKVIKVAEYWWDHHRSQHPISIEFSQQGLADEMSAIYRCFNVDYVSRVIGPLPSFNMLNGVEIKRRKRKPIPPGMI